MPFSIRQFDAEQRFCDHLSLDLFAHVIAPDLIRDALETTVRRPTRHRKLTPAATLLLTIALNLFTDESVADVFARLARGLRFVWPDPDLALPSDSALSQRRYQLGARPLAALFRSLCRPIASEATTGAFAYGLRLMALDASKERLADTPSNEAAFGRSSNAKGASPFPHLHGVYLVECATHAIVDAGIWRCSTNERRGAWRLLRSIQDRMLVLMDSGFYSCRLLQALQARGAQVLGRMPGQVKPTLVRTLSDGSALAQIAPARIKRPSARDRMTVRVIRYTVPDAKRPGRRTTCRLVTTLVDEVAYPAVELVCLYHERWEIELVFDEIDTHQRVVGRPMRSLRSVGVVQEFYALLIAHYAVRYLMHEAGVEAEVDPRRLSFVGALRVIREAVAEFQMAAASEHERLYARMLRDIARKQLPQRRNRQNPRVVKRQQSRFLTKRAEHRAWPQPPRPFRDLVLLI